MIRSINKTPLWILAVAVLLIFGCTDIEENQSSTSPDKDRVPDQESWQSTIIMTRDGKKFAEIWAGYIAYFNEEAQTILSDSIHADFYDRNGDHNSVLTADSGLVYNRSNNLWAYGDVRVVSDSGIVLQTRELHWDNDRQKIISDVQVKFTTKEDTLLGDSFISDPDLKNYEIKNARGFSQRKISLTK
ncbi:MAG: LPS export ABC transporter periplasmic protein LptC [Calditrichaeota bacterium]|nr:LPS export ABC transporter periplasmic protein LptC [Calditrichota bacterium]RQV98577.1 MAG: LPS export ABC transporter periplasmic protein LptC [Calditrichota bacterium]